MSGMLVVVAWPSKADLARRIAAGLVAAGFTVQVELDDLFERLSQVVGPVEGQPVTGVDVSASSHNDVEIDWGRVTEIVTGAALAGSADPGQPVAGIVVEDEGDD